MNFVELFLLKVSVCLLVFYLPYLMLFRRTTFFVANRIYLLSAIVFSFILPLIVLPATEQFIPKVIFEFYEPVLTQLPSTRIDSYPESKIFSLSLILMGIYFMGIAVHTVRLLLSIQHILKIKHQNKILIVDNVQIMQTDSSEPFSFFNTIFLPNAGAAPPIIEHERAHIRQFHWIDLIILEITSIILWFNPMMVVYKRSLKLQHEYLADDSVMQRGTTIEEYLACMSNQLSPIKTFSLTSSFYFQSIKKRITMLTIKKTSRQLSGLYLIIIPIIACLLFAFSSQPDYQLNPEAGDSTIQKELSFISPVKASQAKLSSEFGERMHPILRVKKFHTGIDLIAEEGVPVMSAEVGIVTDSNFDSLQGNFIVIQHGSVYSTYYSHLKMRSVQIGDKVQKQSTIGQVGNTGLSIGSHLHYEIRKNGQPINPKVYLGEIK
ncbi:MAG: peptidoglycan DD-metalloendopeptidase family protein [Cyclobacteriaceae bacterium]